MKKNFLLTHWCSIRKDRVIVDGNVDRILENFSNFAGFLKAIYREEQLTYPKFFKMDLLGKAGFLAAEKLIRASHVTDRYSPDETGIIVFNSSASLDTDIEYQKTIEDRSNYYPSPSLFVYTLPNILIGEICIRHKIKGENAFFISEKFDAEMIGQQLSLLMDAGRSKACIGGWIEVTGAESEAFLFLVEDESSAFADESESKSIHPFTAKNLNLIYHHNVR